MMAPKLKLILLLWWILLFFATSFGAPAQLYRLSNTQVTGAVCLDGSPAGYYFREGTGQDKSKWILHLDGGAWCPDEGSCLDRSKTNLGSSVNWASTSSPQGVLSDDPIQNPDFHNWNLGFFGYCDGSSFTGHLDAPINYKGTNLYFRGQDILKANIEDLLQNRGMNSATEVIFSGCSAGGLGVYFGLDRVRELLPTTIKLVGLADAGWFLNKTSLIGAQDYPGIMPPGFKLWNSIGGINQACVRAKGNNAVDCMWAFETFPFIKTPLFVLNAKYDSAQLGRYGLDCINHNQCNSTQLAQFINYGEDQLTSEKIAINSPTTGVFLDACVQHCQSQVNTWSRVSVDGSIASHAFADWYFHNTGKSKWVDTCQWPCNKAC